MRSLWSAGVVPMAAASSVMMVCNDPSEPPSTEAAAEMSRSSTVAAAPVVPVNSLPLTADGPALSGSGGCKATKTSPTAGLTQLGTGVDRQFDVLADDHRDVGAVVLATMLVTMPTSVPRSLTLARAGKFSVVETGADCDAVADTARRWERNLLDGEARELAAS